MQWKQLFLCCKELFGKGFERSTEGDKKQWLKTSLLILILAQQLGQISKQDHKKLFQKLSSQMNSFTDTGRILNL